jgi:hypothetical protein
LLRAPENLLSPVLENRLFATVVGGSGTSLYGEDNGARMSLENDALKGEMIAVLTRAMLLAAQAAFGPGRELEARFDETSGRVELFVYLTVVEAVTQPERELALGELRRRNIEAHLGEELGFQIFWHPSDADLAQQQDAELAGLLAELQPARAAFGRTAAQMGTQAVMEQQGKGRAL